MVIDGKTGAVEFVGWTELSFSGVLGCCCSVFSSV